MRTQGLLDFCAWIEDTHASHVIANTPWIVPTVQTIHILAIAAVWSAAFMIDLRLLGLAGRDQPLARVSARFRPLIWWSLPILLVTGAIMITGEPARSLANWVFQLKMLLLIGAIGVTLGFQAPLNRDGGYWEASNGRRGAARSIAVVSLLLWMGIICAGRWIAYT